MTTNEKLGAGRENPENDLEHLRKKLDEAEEEETQIRKERQKIIDDIGAGRSGAKRNLNDYLNRLKQAEQKTIETFVAWGDAMAKEHPELEE